MGSEQTTDQTFRVTHTPDGRIGVTVFVEGKPGVVLWLDAEDPRAAERLALHLETQIDRVSGPPASRELRRPPAA
jgi:hypothetical protein